MTRKKKHKTSVNCNGRQKQDRTCEQCICEHILLRTWSASLFKGPRFWCYNPNPSTIIPHPHLREGQRCGMIERSKFKLRINFWWWHVTPVNPCHGCGFFSGSKMPTRARARTNP